MIVGCGLGADAEFIAAWGYSTLAFDIAPTAVELARSRFPSSAVSYVPGDLLALPDEWVGRSTSCTSATPCSPCRTR